MGIVDYNGEMRFFHKNDILRKCYVTICEKKVKATKIVKQDGKYILWFEEYLVDKRLTTVGTRITFPDGSEGSFLRHNIIATKHDTLVCYVCVNYMNNI